MDTANWVQILNEAVCISQSVNTLRKDMNPIILTPTMELGLRNYLVKQTGLFNFGIATGQGEGKLWIQTC